MEKVTLQERPAFVTLDGSEIRELAGVPSGNAVNQSLAQATVPPGASTFAHHHRTSEEIYYFTAGAGRMVLGGEESEVHAGDCVVIPPHVPHGGAAGPEGCTVIDVFTPPRAGIVALMD